MTVSKVAVSMLPEMYKSAWAFLSERVPAIEDGQLFVGVRLSGDWENLSRTAHH